MHKIKFNILFTLFLATIPALTQAADTLQVARKYYSKNITINYELGNVLKTHDFVRGNNPEQLLYTSYRAFSLEYGIQTDGRKLYQQIWGYPNWGFGFYKMYILNDKELGHPFALYTFFDAPFYRWKKMNINFKVGFGLCYNWNRHKLMENNYDYPIGSKMTVHFDFGLKSDFYLSKYFDASAEIVFTHFSNGAIQLPNLGLNFIGASMGIKYYFQRNTDLIRQEVPEFVKTWEAIFLLSPSIKQVGFEYLDQNGELKAKALTYKIFTFSPAINRQVGYKSKFGAGIDISFNESYLADTLLINFEPQKASYKFSDKILVGFYPSYELVINQVSLILQPGLYIYGKNPGNVNRPITYQRVGLRYHFKNNMIIGVNVRASNFTIADFIEWNLGYRLQIKKKQK